MPPEYRYRSLSDSGAVLTETDITDYFRLYTLDVTMNAEEGSVAQSTIFADDPDGDLDVTGHRRLRIVEDTATGSNTTIWVGYTAARRYHRGDSTRTTVSRAVDIDIVDVNSILARRIFDRASADRPAETDVARGQWLLGTEEAQLIDDDLYFNTQGAVAMDAVDYQGQTVENVLNDMAQQSGKNYFVWYNDATNQYSLYYDFANGSNYTSPLRLTNVLSEVDNSLTFAISQDTELSRSPDRVYSGAYLSYDGGAIYTQRETTADTFARRDASMPGENVKTATKARARASRYLASIATEEDVITTTVLLPAAKQGFLMQGMRVQFKATHLPGYESYVFLRALNRSVRQASEEFYEVKLELSTTSTALSCTQTDYGSFYPLGGSGNTPNPSGGNVLYLRPGVDYATTPTPGHEGRWHFPTYGAGGSGTTDRAETGYSNRVRSIVEGEGVITVHTSAIGGAIAMVAILQHADPGAPNGQVTDETQTGESGDDFVFEVSSHGGVNCTHWVDVYELAEPGLEWGYSGTDWSA